MLIVILEFRCYLSPELHESGVDIVISCGEIGSVDPFLLMVEVEDNVQTDAVCVVNYLMNSCHPGGIDVVVLVKVLEPGCRYADCVEALCLDGVEELLSCLGAAPAGLCLKTGAVQRDILCGIAGIRLFSVSIKSITEVPAYFHVFCDLECCHYVVCCVGGIVERSKAER